TTSGKYFSKIALVAGLSSNSPSLLDLMVYLGAASVWTCVAGSCAQAGKARSKARLTSAVFMAGLLGALGLEARDMAHLPPGPGFFLAIEMQRPAFGQAIPGMSFGADDVFHHRVGVAGGIAQGPAGHGTNMLFELRALTGLDGPMAGIVDARRDLIDQQFALSSHEQFHRKDTHIVQGIADRLGDGLCLIHLRLAQARRHG